VRYETPSRNIDIQYLGRFIVSEQMLTRQRNLIRSLRVTDVMLCYAHSADGLATCHAMPNEAPLRYAIRRPSVSYAEPVLSSFFHKVILLPRFSFSFSYPHVLTSHPIVQSNSTTPSSNQAKTSSLSTPTSSISPKLAKCTGR
jgi:hypothetical protein